MESSSSRISHRECLEHFYEGINAKEVRYVQFQDTLHGPTLTVKIPESEYWRINSYCEIVVNGREGQDVICRPLASNYAKLRVGGRYTSPPEVRPCPYHNSKSPLSFYIFDEARKLLFSWKVSPKFCVLFDIRPCSPVSPLPPPPSATRRHVWWEDEMTSDVRFFRSTDGKKALNELTAILKSIN
jgi:hypothetical protein